MELAMHLKAVGIMMLGLAGMNFLLPRKLNWREELARLSPLNRQIFIVHCTFIVLTISMFGVLSLFFTRTLLEPGLLPRLVLAGLTLFWLVRLAAQLLFYSPDLWRGKRFETSMHVLFTTVWCYFAAVYATAFWRLI